MSFSSNNQLDKSVMDKKDGREAFVMFLSYNELRLLAVCPGGCKRQINELSASFVCSDNNVCVFVNEFLRMFCLYV